MRSWPSALPRARSRNDGVPLKATHIRAPAVRFQGLQWKFAKMAMDVDAARLLVYRAVSNAAQGFPTMLESSMAKAYANEMAIRVNE